ncbi:MAG: hypothetical protein ABW352_25565 [Polyangiales bacterium]
MRRLILGLGLLLVACGDDDEETSGGLDGGTLIDASMPAPPDASFDAGVPDASHDAGPTLCGKYGGAAGIERAIKQFVIVELATDCDVGPHFTMLSSNRLARFSDCLAYQAQELFGCPGVTYAGSKSYNDLPCRDMKTAHAGLRLSSGDFDAVIADVASGLLKAGVAQADINQVAPALLSLEPQIVEAEGEQPTMACGGADAGR